MTAITNKTLMDQITDNSWLGKNAAMRYVLLAVAGSLLLWVSAKTQVPFWPVPLTMQPFAVLAIGMMYGGRLAFATVGLYLLEGAVGLPVFANGGGLLYFLTPTAGFLVGFLFAATFCGFMAERGFDKNILSAVAVGSIGMVIIYAFGLAWLGNLIGVEAAFAAVSPYFAGDAVKVALVALLLPTAWKFVKK